MASWQMASWQMASLMASAPTGFRTPVLALRGLCPRPLDDGGLLMIQLSGKILPCVKNLVNGIDVTIPAMWRSKWSKLFGVILGLGLLAGVIYQIPWVEQRLSWRIDIARTYLRGVLQPAGPVPTPKTVSETASRVTPSPSVIPPTVLLPTPQPPGEEKNQGESLANSLTPTPKYSPSPSPTLTPIPERVELPPPKWERQDWNNCGPAALSMYLNYYSWEGDQFSVSSVLKPVREDRNVNVDELVYYARNYAGWLQTEYRVGGNLSMLKAFIAAEIPVIIEASFYFDGAYWPNDDLWAAHYLLVTGYNETKGTFTVQDTFHGPNQVLKYKTLDAYWKPFNRVYLLVYLPYQEETVKTILGPAWDEVTNRQQAQETAQAEIDADPKDAFAWFNLGSNLVYFERYEEAAAAYDQARTIGWPQRMLRYQFGPFFAYFHAGRTEDLLTLTKYALERTPNSEEALLWNGWGFYRQGNLNTAVADFQAALEANPLYQDARYALDYVTGQ
jgi:tetratricopeptide (TPR) repeat protein